jgi:hypothetical protein
MSIKVMARVWAESLHAGTELLMLLALADFADDDGNAFPSVPTLATKCRMTTRNANLILVRLRRSGELEVRPNRGLRGTNLYRVVPGGGSRSSSPLKQPSALKSASAPNSLSPLMAASSTPEAGFLAPLKHASDEPSLKHQDPTRESTASTSRLPPCPHRQVLALFQDLLPGLPQPRVELWTGSAAARELAGRWKWVLTAKRASGASYATNVEEALAWFGRFFDAVAASDFLTGRNGRWTKCNLQWLVRRENFAKVIEGHYINNEVVA